MNAKNITLQEELEKFYESHPENLSHTDGDLPKNVQRFFLSHDVVHVVFGCDTSLYGEGLVKFWSIFGTTLGFWKHIAAYKQANAYELSKQFSPIPAISDFFRLLIAVPSLIVRAKKMTKTWPWENFESYLEKPIGEIRAEFNIRIF